MLGFFGMIVAFVGVNCLLSYWVSWDMQHRETRPGFGTQIGNDVAELLQSLTAKRRRATEKKSVGRGLTASSAR